MTLSALLASDTTDYEGLLVWFTILFLAIVAMGVVVIFARKKFLESRQNDGQGGGFEIENIEALRNSLTDEEFSLLRKRALGLTGENEKKSTPSSRPGANQDDDK